MVCFPNCKINIGLYITAKRSDGFHDLETIFFPIQWNDVLEFFPSSQNHTALHLSGLSIPGSPSNNLVLKAYHLIKQDYPHLPHLNIFLHKILPLGAGLGGGSANGAFMLKALNQYFNLNIHQDQLLNYALQLGSDCPFFIYNQPCFAKGRGEVLTPLSIQLSGKSLVLINPGIHVNTQWAFQQIIPQKAAFDLHQIESVPIGEWKYCIANQFEAAVLEAHPAVGDIKKILYQKGALYAAMSGSGSTVFGIFESGAIQISEFPNNYLVKKIDL